jgi:hypothetical protein
MSSDTKTSEATGSQTELPGGGNIDNIREILFGAQMRQYDKRFQRIEDLLAKECGDLREELRRRLDALETFTKQETEALTDNIKAEKEERKGGATDLGKELTALGKELEKRSTRIEEKFSKGLRDLRANLLDQSKSLSKEIKDSNDGLLADINRELEELRSDKTDRAALISLFNEMALRLGDQLHLPDPES